MTEQQAGVPQLTVEDLHVRFHTRTGAVDAVRV